MIKSLHTSLLFTVFLLFINIPTLATVTIDGVTFDSTVVNDYTNQATPADYFCTQAGIRVTLSGRPTTIEY
jgi:hypothetical protein